MKCLPIKSDRSWTGLLQRKTFHMYQHARLYHRVNHYKTLGVKSTATQAEIKAAYVKLCKKLHPDVNRSDPKSHEKIVSLNNAYAVLCKPESRRQYDLVNGFAFTSRQTCYRPHPQSQYYQRQSEYNSRTEEDFKTWGSRNRFFKFIHRLHVDAAFSVSFYMGIRVIPLLVISVFGLIINYKDYLEAEKEKEKKLKEKKYYSR